jgi:hypothetical protein
MAGVGAEIVLLCEAVTSRVIEYCGTLGLSCDVTTKQPFDLPFRAEQTVHVRDSAVAPPPWKGDDALPENLQHILMQVDSNMDIVVEVSSAAAPPAVQVQAYQHSAHGRKVVEKVKSQLEGEVCRTSRLWRRRQQNQCIHGADVRNSQWYSEPFRSSQ